MALRLRVISDHRHRLGEKSTFVFGVSGGSIGRSAENDWVLPDDMRYVSGRHARIVYHKGRYLLQDTSSNGTYVNDGDRPLGNQNPHELKSGDVLRIGEYHVQVQVDSSNDFTLDDSALYKNVTGATSSRRRLPPSDLGASLRLENLLEASNDISSDELKPVNAFGQAVSARTRALTQTQDLPKEASTNPELEVDSEAVARRIAPSSNKPSNNPPPFPLPPRLRSRRRLPRPRPTIRRGYRRSAAEPASDPKHCPSMHTPACCISPDSSCVNPCSDSRKAAAPSTSSATPCV
jgi:type VI secretion system FHA domain protein